MQKSVQLSDSQPKPVRRCNGPSLCRRAGSKSVPSEGFTDKCVSCEQPFTPENPVCCDQGFEEVDGKFYSRDGLCRECCRPNHLKPRFETFHQFRNRHFHAESKVVPRQSDIDQLHITVRFRNTDCPNPDEVEAAIRLMFSQMGVTLIGSVFLDIEDLGSILEEGE